MDNALLITIRQSDGRAPYIPLPKGEDFAAHSVSDRSAYGGNLEPIVNDLTHSAYCFSR